MASKTKWIDAESGDEPISQVARRTIRARLKNVCRWLPVAAEDGLEDGDAVHQMRVATRRALVAVDLFAALLPHKKYRWLRKRLKRIRQAAGPARDLDVMAKRLTNNHSHAAVDRESVKGEAARDEGLSHLLRRVREARSDAQDEVEKLAGKLKQKDFKARGKKLASKVRWRSANLPEPTYAEMGRTEVRSIVGEFFAAAEADLSSTAALHQVRLVIKRLRYSMEVFADAFGDGFREELYPLAAELQEKLGAVNDHATAREQYLQWLTDATDEPQRAVLESLISHENAAIEQATHAFRQWWTPQRAADQRSRFLQELAAVETRCA